MRFSLAILAAALVSTVSASLVARQTTSLPACALQCITTANFGSCQATDNACLCKNQDFVTSSTNCIVSTCKGGDLQAALNASQQLCAAVGVTLTSTPAALATATNSGTSSSSTTSPAASTNTNAASMNGISTVAGVAALLAAIAL